MKVPVNLSRYSTPVRVDCDCQKKPVDLEFKIVTLQWLCEAGRVVKKDEVICEAEVEKTFIEVLSPVDGVLAEICISNNEECDIHKAIAYIEAE